MRVSSKIFSGFLIVMLLSVLILAHQLSVVHQMQAVNQDLLAISFESGTNVLRMQKLIEQLEENARKYLSVLDPIYHGLILDDRQEFLERLALLRTTAVSERERTEAEKFGHAMDEYWRAYNELKQQNNAFDPLELPPDLNIAINHFQHQGEVMLDAVELAIRERVVAAGKTVQQAERYAWIAGLSSVLLGVVVAAFSVTAINAPLRRLVQGTRAIAKGQFWHRLPVRGRDEFTELSRDFNAMTERLGELDQMKKDFVSHVSHDLKAPLASIRQIMHLLLQEIPGSLNEQQKNLIQLSYRGAERLAAMVGNLLDVSRMEAGTMEYRMASQDIVPLIKEVIEEFEVQAREKQLEFQIRYDEPSYLVECDRERIVQVIGNLYENALKFAPSRSEILTHIREGRGGEILISVADAGPGVPDGQKEQIFEKFQQGKNAKKLTSQGVGLGLAICKTIVEAHRGQIWVEDNPSGGSIFSFVLKPATRKEVLTCGQTA
jgi:two-component system sensor histidine kinase GlrK